MATASSDTVSIGICIGNTNSYLSLNKLGSIEIVAAETGERSIPSFVSFTETGKLFGEAAQNQQLTNAKNTFTNLLTEFVKNSATEHATTLKTTETYKTPDLLKLIVERLRNLATSYSGINCIDTVLTYPIHFNETQRTQYKSIAESAGCTVLDMIPEPIAACLAYNLDTIQSTQNILVFDLGGTSLSLSVVSSVQGLLSIKSTFHSTEFGGSLFDDVLIKHFTTEFKRKNDGLDLTSNERAMFRLRLAVEKLKLVLSSSSTGAIELDGLMNGIDFYSNLTKARFQSLTSELCRNLIEPIQSVIGKASLLSKDINTVVAIGGASRIHRIADTLRSIFDNKDLIIKLNTVNPDEAAAYGAAVQSEVKQLRKSQSNNKVNNLQVTTLGIGIESFNNELQILIPKGTIVPTKIEFTALPTNKTSELRIIQGEYIKQANNQLNTLLAKIITVGTAQVKVSIDIDNNGIINIKANTVSITIPNDKSRLPLDKANEIIQSTYNKRNEEYKEVLRKQKEEEEKQLAKQAQLDTEEEQAAAKEAEKKRKEEEKKLSQVTQSVAELEIDDLD